MAKQHISMRGEVVDFNRLRINNAEQVALGNAPLNARGDVIGTGGVILKTQEEIENEWAAKIAEQQDLTRAVNIKDQVAVEAAIGIQPTPASKPEVQKQLDVEDASFDPVVETPAPAPASAPKARRKIVESD